MTTEPAMFPAPPRKAKRSPADVKSGVKPTVTRIENVQRKACDHCTRVVHEDGGVGGAEIRTARYRWRDGGCDRDCRRAARYGMGCHHVQYLCAEHKELQTALDESVKPKRRGARRG